MKLRKLFSGILLLVAACLLSRGVSTEAAVSDKIVLIPSAQHETHGYLYVDIQVDISLKNIKTIEAKQGKIKKTADKYWKDSYIVEDFYYDEETGKVSCIMFIDENDTYSVRVTTKSGKKYVNYIKISNLAPVSERGKMTAVITKVSKPDSNGNYTITADYKTEVSASADTFAGKKAGDIVSINGRKVELREFRKMDEDYNVITSDKYDDSIECIAVMPLNLTDFYDLEKNEYLVENPEYADFGFIRSYADKDLFIAYDDYEYWDGGDYYVPIYDTALTGVKLKVTADTNVKLAYVDREIFGDDAVISGRDYCAIRRGTKEIDGVYVFDSVEVRIYEKYSKKKGFTNTVSEIAEIYSP